MKVGRREAQGWRELAIMKHLEHLEHPVISAESSLSFNVPVTVLYQSAFGYPGSSMFLLSCPFLSYVPVLVSGHIASSQIASMETMSLKTTWQCTHTCRLPSLKNIYIYLNKRHLFLFNQFHLNIYSTF